MSRTLQEMQSQGTATQGALTAYVMALLYLRSAAKEMFGYIASGAHFITDCPGQNDHAIGVKCIYFEDCKH